MSGGASAIGSGIGDVAGATAGILGSAAPVAAGMSPLTAGLLGVGAMGILPSLFGGGGSGSGGISVPSRLPSYNIKPTFYNPNSFAARILGKDPWGDMAALMAGPQYIPRQIGGQPSMGLGGNPTPTLVAMMKKQPYRGIR